MAVWLVDGVSIHAKVQTCFMTSQELASLPLGSVIKLDDEEGEIVRAGQTVHILWPDSHVTNVIDTNAKVWHDFIGWLEAE